MSKLLANPFARLACWYLSALFAGLFALPAVGHAALVPAASAPADPSALAAVRASLEDDLLRERLSSLGVSADDVRARLDNLTADERQAVLADLSSVQAGGDGVVGLLLVILLVIIIVKLLDKEIVIQ